MSVFNAVHDLAAVDARITGPESLYGQRRVALALGVAGHRYPVFKCLADLDEPILGHHHYGFLIALEFSPLDAEMVRVDAGGCGRGGSGGCAGGAGRGWEDGEMAGQDHLLRQGPSDRRTPLHPQPTGRVWKQERTYHIIFWKLLQTHTLKQISNVLFPETHYLTVYLINRFKHVMVS